MLVFKNVKVFHECLYPTCTIPTVPLIMASLLGTGKLAAGTRAIERGLEPGYAEDKWGPWKSHKLLLSEALATSQSWADRNGVLSRTFAAFGRSRPGFLSEKEFNDILNSFVCCEEIFYHHFFQLFDRDQDGYLSELDFISGMLSVSPVTDHNIQSPCGQLRLQLIFLYYDANRNGRLDVEELSLMIEHLEQLRMEKNDKGPKLEMRMLAVSDAKSLMSLYKGGFWFRCLYDSCVKGMLTGMEQLLRTSGDLATAILKINPQLGDGQANVYQPQLQANVYQSPPEAKVYQPQAPHPVPNVPKVSEDVSWSTIAKPQVSQLVTPNHPYSFPPPTYAGPTTNTVSETRRSLDGALDGVIPLPLRIVRGLMDYTSTPSVDWRGLKLLTAAEMLALCTTILPVLREEDSLVSVPFPARVYGDIHGNLPDLIQLFSKYSWPDKRRGDILSMNYVFLGDYVDRGAFSVEVVATLFSLKLLYPRKVHLVRGNHEDRNLNYHFGFRKSCLHHFGPVEGQLVWERVNECFDHLALGALIGEEVFCIHGGIGTSIDAVADVMGIKKPIIVPPETEDPARLDRLDRVVLDALWSDPATEQIAASGAQSPRGSGASRFTAERLKAFVAANNLQLVIRAHECVQNGYEYFADGLLLTLFSASSYCNQHKNDGAIIVLVKNEDGSMEEQPQIIKTNPDSRIGWEDVQFRQPTPMRSMNMLPATSTSQFTPLAQQAAIPPQRMRMPFIPVTYPASPSSSRIF